jgi:hypothetical protein
VDITNYILTEYPNIEEGFAVMHRLKKAKKAAALAGLLAIATKGWGHTEPLFTKVAKHHIKSGLVQKAPAALSHLVR